MGGTPHSKPVHMAPLEEIIPSYCHAPLVPPPQVEIGLQQSTDLANAKRSAHEGACLLEESGSSRNSSTKGSAPAGYLSLS